MERNGTLIDPEEFADAKRAAVSPTVDIQTRSCPHCGEQSVLTVDLGALAAWKNGMVIQQAFPEMSVDDRELLITGIHPECWDAAMGPEE